MYHLRIGVHLLDFPTTQKCNISMPGKMLRVYFVFLYALRSNSCVVDKLSTSYLLESVYSTAPPLKKFQALYQEQKRLFKRFFFRIPKWHQIYSTTWNMRILSHHIATPLAEKFRYRIFLFYFVKKLFRSQLVFYFEKIRCQFFSIIIKIYRILSIFEECFQTCVEVILLSFS